MELYLPEFAANFCWRSTFNIWNIWSIIPLCNLLGDLSMKEKIEKAET